MRDADPMMYCDLHQNASTSGLLGNKIDDLFQYCSQNRAVAASTADALRIVKAGSASKLATGSIKGSFSAAIFIVAAAAVAAAVAVAVAVAAAAAAAAAAAVVAAAAAVAAVAAVAGREPKT